MFKSYYFTRYRNLLRSYRRIKRGPMYVAVFLVISVSCFGNQFMHMVGKEAMSMHCLAAYLSEDSLEEPWRVASIMDYYQESGREEASGLQIVYGPDNYTVLGGPKEESSTSVKETFVTDMTFSAMRSNYFAVDATTVFPEGLVTPQELFSKDLSLEQTTEPQVLIFHTHASEGYSDSREGTEEDTVVGVGEVLAEYLRESGYVVIHDKTKYDVEDGVVNRDVSYNNALDGLEAMLEKHPTIEVIIDVHRDSGAKRVTEVDGRATAQVMLFNGMCRNSNGPISYLPNDNLASNLAFSLQLKCLGDEVYPNFMKRIYLKSYRYNMHLVERDLLVEVGTVNNTVSEAKAAMKPFSELLIRVLQGEN